jgi:hypothetical protein
MKEKHAARIRRFTEPSTWAGIAVLVTLFGGNVAPEVIVETGGAISALLSIFLREKGRDNGIN